jgi:hypothetical protein
MNLTLRHTIKSTVLMSVVEYLQIKESWKSIIKKEQGFVEKKEFVVAVLR